MIRAASRYCTTYAIRMPRSTHTRKATCEEIDCKFFLEGWTVHKERLTSEATHALLKSKLTFRELSVSEGVTYLVFDPGQPCPFAETHRIAVMEPLYYRGNGMTSRTFNPRKAYRHRSPELWVEDFQTNLDHIRTVRERG